VESNASLHTSAGWLRAQFRVYWRFGKLTVLCVATRPDGSTGFRNPDRALFNAHFQGFRAGSTKQEYVWSEVMAQVCDICGKGPQFGNNISHAHNVTRRRWNVNLQAVKALVNGASKRIRVCTSCIKSGKIAKG
jgi:large subunit ribosomal protein L28